jgi:hypothetical protein
VCRAGTEIVNQDGGLAEEAEVPLPCGLSVAIARVPPKAGKETMGLTRTIATVAELVWTHPANRGRRL